jgi:hypothetical protein
VDDRANQFFAFFLACNSLNAAAAWKGFEGLSNKICDRNWILSPLCASPLSAPV